MSMLVSFVLSFFPGDVLDEILNLIGSVSEGFPSYSYYTNPQGLFTQLFFSISFLRRLLDTVLKVTSRPIFVSRCITVTCLLFLWTCIRHENVMRALVIYAFFLMVLTVAL